MQDRSCQARSLSKDALAKGGIVKRSVPEDDLAKDGAVICAVCPNTLFPREGVHVSEHAVAKDRMVSSVS